MSADRDKDKALAEALEATKQILFSEKDLERIGFSSAKTLRNHRYAGTGLPYVKMLRSVKYLRSDLVKYLSQRRVVPSNK